jgi:hypothetical protein
VARPPAAQPIAFADLRRFRSESPGKRESNVAEMSALDTIADKVRAASDRQSGPSPFLAVGVAFAAGVVLAKWIDWRGHAHPSG